MTTSDTQSPWTRKHPQHLTRAALIAYMVAKRSRESTYGAPRLPVHGNRLSFGPGRPAPGDAGRGRVNGRQPPPEHEHGRPGRVLRREVRDRSPGIARRPDERRST